MPGLSKKLMSQVGKGKISMKRAWQIQKGKRRGSKRRNNPGKRRKTMPRFRSKGSRRRGRRRKKSLKRTLSRAAQMGLAFFPEERSLMEVFTMYGGDFSQLPYLLVLNRTGYSIHTGNFDMDKAIANNVISIGGPLLIRYAMRNVK